MQKKRILFMGTTSFAAYVLEQLIQDEYHIIGVVSQPDRKSGRKQVINYTSTKEVALKHELELLAFDDINEHEDVIEKLRPDLIISCAYGQKVSVDILKIPSYGAINVHASVLPKYRGGAPIHHVLINGEKVTGNTIMYMAETLDSGDIISTSIVPITMEDTYDSLSQKLMMDAAQLLLNTLPRFFDNEIKPLQQDPRQVTYAPVIKREDEYIDFKRDTLSVYNHIRGLISVPGPYALLNDKKIKFLLVKYELTLHENEPGQVVIDNDDYFKIACLDGYILVYQFQIEGKKPIVFTAYLHGNKLEINNDAIINKGE